MKKWLVAALLALVLLGVLAAAGWMYIHQQSQPVSATEQPATRFIVPKGQAVSVIAERLAEENFIRNPWLFRVLIKRQGLEDNIQAGSFDLSPSMTMTEIANELTTGTNDIWVTILEGWRREEIAEGLAQAELAEFDQEEFLTLTATSEGRLFPDTYLVPREATANSMATLLTRTFDQKVTQGLAPQIKASGRDWIEILVMASLVQREARNFDQMKEVAGILWNRYDVGMPLQVDATLQFAKGYVETEKKWWATPLAVDRQLASPFNTYLNAGLPPRPISNPGLDALKATLQPNDTTNVFYIHDDAGKMYFAETLEEHNQNIDRHLR